MTSVDLTCQSCTAQSRYEVSQIRLTLYTHGVCTVTFACARCARETEHEVPDRVALHLDSLGASTTIVRTPDEVMEWPDKTVPRIAIGDVGFMQRSSLEYVNECARRELL